MLEYARNTLYAIIAQHGQSLRDDPRRCEALLRDQCGQCECEIQVLMVAVQKKVPDALVKRTDSMPWEVLLCLQGERLHSESGLDRGKARWAVETWALALGTISPAQLSTRRPATGRQQERSPVVADTSARPNVFIIPMVTVRLAAIVVMVFMMLVYLVPAIFPPLVGMAITAGILVWVTDDSHANRRPLWNWLIHFLSCGTAACGQRACGTCVPDRGDCDCLIIPRRKND
jgi:hypothetical protein